MKLTFDTILMPYLVTSTTNHDGDHWLRVVSTLQRRHAHYGRHVNQAPTLAAIMFSAPGHRLIRWFIQPGARKVQRAPLLILVKEYAIFTCRYHIAAVYVVARHSRWRSSARE